MFHPLHTHLLVRCFVKEPIRSEVGINTWLTELVEKVGMKVVAGPTAVYVSEPGNEGVTGTVTLATSHSSIHIWDHEYPSFVQMDLYSCCEFSVDDVVEHLDKMCISSGEFMLVDRNQDLSVVRTGYLPLTQSCS